MKQYYVLIGNFGSGKSELSLNIALQAVKHHKTVFVDLDVVNPYFRAAERKEDLERAGVRMLYPVFAFTTVDVPSVPPDIYSVFLSDEETVVFDVGGDPTGATALGQYKANFDTIPKENLHVYYVLNQKRPLSETPDLVENMIERITYRSRLPITGLINNTNLAGETQAGDLLDGYHLVKEVSTRTGIPVAYTTGIESALDEFQKIVIHEQLDQAFIGELKQIEIYMHRDWDRFTTLGI